MSTKIYSNYCRTDSAKKPVRGKYGETAFLSTIGEPADVQHGADLLTRVERLDDSFGSWHEDCTEDNTNSNTAYDFSDIDGAVAAEQSWH